jgi:hypothetical protein
MPVTTDKRMFSKLKCIRNSIRNNLSREKTTSLGIVAIEKEIANSIEHDDTMD